MSRDYTKQLMLQFMRKWELSPTLIYKNEGEKQAMFIRDTICLGLLGVPCFKVSEHTSKSVHLPVYGFIMRNGIKVICRENFYDWKVSVELPQPLPVGYIHDDIFTWYRDDPKNPDKKEDIPSCYLEGFKDEWAWPMYNPTDKTQTKFTVELGNNYDFYMLMYMLKSMFDPTINNFNASDDKRTVKELKDDIDRIYDRFGYNDTFTHRDETSRLMDGDDILHYTYRAVRACNKDDGRDDISSEMMDNTLWLAQFLIDHPTAHNTFMWEEHLLNYEF